MSSRHFFTSPEGLVTKALRGIVAYNPDLRLDEETRVVFDSRFDPTASVALISGGGGGHEPAWAGYVGSNMLAASVSGDIFASPGSKQILSAIELVSTPSPSSPSCGTILVVTNYTGDCLHFGLATEKAVAAGYNCRMLICGDDVSVGRTAGSSALVGRRGLAGQIGVLKVMGAAAGSGASLDEVYDLGQAVAVNTVSLAATLDHCHVPGRTVPASFSESTSSTTEIGTGPHNEPGHARVSPAPSASELVATMLRYCLDPADPLRAYTAFQPGDEVVVLVSNFGGVSPLELGALVDEILVQLEQTWSITPVRVYAGPLETSLNAMAASLSLINITNAARQCTYSTTDIRRFLDTHTGTHWEAISGSQSTRTPGQVRGSQFVPSKEKEDATGADASPKQKETPALHVDSALLARMLRKAAQNIVDAEPDLTRWDMVLGDGDCGETLRTGALALLQAVDEQHIAAEGSVVRVLQAIETIVENRMGGTLGGILAIFFVALRTGFEQNGHLADAKDGLRPVWAVALKAALESLSRYTPARVGDRTVLDTLIPFVQAMAGRAGEDGGSGGDGKNWNVLDFAACVEAAVQGAEDTRTMKPRLGRATYVTQVDNGDLPPDPGAWGAMMALKGLREAMSC